MAAVTDPSIWEAETAEGASERAAAAARAAERAASVAAERIAMQEAKTAGDEASAGRSIDSPRTLILRRALGPPTMRCDDRFTMNRWR